MGPIIGGVVGALFCCILLFFGIRGWKRIQKSRNIAVAEQIGSSYREKYGGGTNQLSRVTSHSGVAMVSLGSSSPISPSGGGGFTGFGSAGSSSGGIGMAMEGGAGFGGKRRQTGNVRVSVVEGECFLILSLA